MGKISPFYISVPTRRNYSNSDEQTWDGSMCVSLWQKQYLKTEGGKNLISEKGGLIDL